MLSMDNGLDGRNSYHLSLGSHSSALCHPPPTIAYVGSDVLSLIRECEDDDDNDQPPRIASLIEFPFLQSWLQLSAILNTLNAIL